MPHQLSAGISAQLKDLIDPALAAIDKAIDLVGEEAVVAYLTAEYDQYIVPIDIPYVPEAMEKVIDAIAKKEIKVLVSAAHKAIHKPAPAPTPAPTPDPAPDPVPVNPPGAAHP